MVFGRYLDVCGRFWAVGGTKKKSQPKSQGLQEGASYLVPHGAMQATSGPSKVGVF